MACELENRSERRQDFRQGVFGLDFVQKSRYVRARLPLGFRQIVELSSEVAPMPKLFCVGERKRSCKVNWRPEIWFVYWDSGSFHCR